MVRAKVEVPFTDLECNVMRSVGSSFECSEDRFDQLFAKGLVSSFGDASPSDLGPLSKEEEPAPAVEEAAPEDSKPDRMWTASEISAWAESRGIDLSGAKKSKATMLARIEESRLGL